MSEQAKAKFEVGDVVQLKSGGDAMTVVAGPDHDGEYRVAWFKVEGLDAARDPVFSNELSHACVPPSALERVPEPKSDGDPN